MHSRGLTGVIRGIRIVRNIAMDYNPMRMHTFMRCRVGNSRPIGRPKRINTRRGSVFNKRAYENLHNYNYIVGLIS